MAVDGRIRELWILHHATIFGGGERVVVKLVGEALGRGLRARVACEPDTEFGGRVRGLGAEVVPLAYPDLRPPALFRAPGTVRVLHRMLKSPPPDVAVVASGPRPQAYASWSRPGTKLVHLAHERDTAGRRSARIVLPRTGTVVAIGSNAAAAYREALGVPVRAVNNILDGEELAEGARSRERAPEAAGGPPRLGALVRMIPEKGLAELVDELTGCPGAWASMTVGALPQDPAYARAVERRIAASALGDRIRLVGPVSDLHGFFEEVDVLVVPSIGHEGQPTAILDALAHGRGVLVRRPVWSADYAGLPVGAYRDATDFASALRALEQAGPAPLAELERAFGAGQALDGILEAALSVRR